MMKKDAYPYDYYYYSDTITSKELKKPTQHLKSKLKNEAEAKKHG